MLSKEDIRFKTENGFCPYFIYAGKKYFIRDTKINDKWMYRLEVKTINNNQTLSFLSQEEAQAYISEKINRQRYTCLRLSDRTGYIATDTIYVLKANIVEIIKTPDPLSGEFDTYAECLDFAKSYIEKLENNQMTLFA